MYRIPKLHKKPYTARFIANSTSSTTSKLSILLTSWLTAIKTHVIRYCDKVYENTGKHLFWSIKNSGEILDKLKMKNYQASTVSTYDFSTLYKTLPHNLINDKLFPLFRKPLHGKKLHFLHVTLKKPSEGSLCFQNFVLHNSSVAAVKSCPVLHFSVIIFSGPSGSLMPTL
jgi:hypothetical protein